MIPESGFTTEEVAELRDLLEMEKIKKKRELYSHLLDSLQLERWVEIFAEDAVGDWGPLGDWNGRADIYKKIQGSMKNRVPYYSMHMTSNMWVELTSPSTASSCSYLHDINNDLSARISPMKLLGVYEENWEKIDGEWLIKVQRFQQLWPERATSADFPRAMVLDPG